MSRQRRALAALAASAALAPSLAACGASDANSDTPGVHVSGEDALHLLARVDLADGGRVAFYEPEPGVLVMLESGRGDAVRAVDAAEARLPPDARYERLAGGPAPPALAAAVARARENAPRPRTAEGAAPRESDTPGDDEPVGQVTQGLGWMERDAFRGRFCGDTDGTDLMWLNRTGSGSIGQRSDRNWVRSAVRVQRGQVRFVFKTRPWYTWRDQADVRIDAGYYESVEVWNNVDFDIKGSVSEADGDVYDFCTSHGTGTIWLPA